MVFNNIVSLNINAVLYYGHDSNKASRHDQTSKLILTQITPHSFQAPEQLKGGKVSAKCDVYALGGVLTELF